MTQKVEWHRKKTDQTKVRLEIDLPPDFPAKYRRAIEATARNCLVARLAKGMGPQSFQREVTIAQGEEVEKHGSESD
jgi:hypothetical protein